MNSATRCTRTVSFRVPWFWREGGMRMRLLVRHEGASENGHAFNDIEPVRSADVVLGEGDSVLVGMAHGNANVSRRYVVENRGGRIFRDGVFVVPLVGERSPVEIRPIVVPSLFTRREAQI